jgi:hypothetical protein
MHLLDAHAERMAWATSRRSGVGVPWRARWHWRRRPSVQARNVDLVQAVQAGLQAAQGLLQAFG